MKKIMKNVEKNGKGLITDQSKKQGYYSHSSNIIMSYGFKILYLNMIFGVLPITIWRSRVKYFKYSISQLYSFVFFICFVNLSVIFVRLEFMPQHEWAGTANVTNVVIVVAIAVTNIGGYLVILLRSYFLARKFPVIWNKLCKLVHIAVVDVYGEKCHLFKKAEKFSYWSVAEFILIMTATCLGWVIISEKYHHDFEDSLKHYYIYYIIPWGNNSVVRTPLQEFQLRTFQAGFFVWKSCNSSHILVSMLLSYIVLLITISLTSVNRQIQELVDIVENNDTVSSKEETCIPRLKYIKSLTTATFLEFDNEDCIIKRLDEITKTMLFAEDVIRSTSRLWGISLIMEALVLIATGTTSVYGVLCTLQRKSNPNEFSFGLLDGDQLLGFFIAICVHFHFLYKSCLMVDRMQDEANGTLHLLKLASSNSTIPARISKRIQELKSDLSSCNMVLTAGGYFHVNKYLLTSVLSQITTYVIVLLQSDYALLERKTTGSNSTL